MKVAFISNHKYIGIQRRRGFHMCLAQYILKDPLYAAMYSTLNRAGCFIIIDNGAAEEEPLSLERLKYAASLVGADEIILPDAIKDSETTLRNARVIQNLGIIPVCKRMVVPQGKDWDEWQQCLDELAALVDFSTIGIPKHLESLPGGRQLALEYIQRKGYTDYNIHLLGVFNDPIKEIHILGGFDFVRSIDTAAPLAYAQANVLLSSVSELSHVSVKWEQIADYEVVLSNVHYLDEIAHAKTLSGQM